MSTSPDHKPGSQPTKLPSSVDFASEVKADRLNMLWRITLALSTVICVFAFSFGFSAEVNVYIWVAAPGVLFLFSLATRFALKYERLDIASEIFTLGGIATVCVAMLSGDAMTLRIAPFMFIVVIFIGGLLLSPASTILMACAAAILTLMVPFVVTEGWDFLGTYQVFAIVLTFVGAFLAVQVTGELYAIAEWALQNYQRERRSNLDLFESRNQLHRSLKRSEALSERLKEINQELDEARQAAEVAKNFRGQFLANMSHELRTPLNAIIGFSETMLKFPMMYGDEDLPGTYRGDLQQIFGSGQQLLHLINDILDLARVDAGKLDIYMQRVTLQPILDTVLATASGLIGSKPVELRKDIPDPLPEVWADESRIRQVLLNLYSNAAKFTDAGTITLRIQETEEGVQFSICDTGSGIPADQLDAIFEEFEQAEAEGRDPRAGSGLGLAISRQLLKLMNGRIWAESEPNRGSTFHFVLPPYHTEKTATVETKSLSADMKIGSETIQSVETVSKPGMVKTNDVQSTQTEKVD